LRIALGGGEHRVVRRVDRQDEHTAWVERVDGAFERPG
jgi:hypothetical protein